MTTPVCPPHYTCQFSPVKHHFLGPWYEGGGGLAVAIIGIISLVIVLCTLAYYAHESWRTSQDNKHDERVEREERAHQLALEEQRTMQLDAAKGNVEMLKLVQERIR